LGILATLFSLISSFDFFLKHIIIYLNKIKEIKFNIFSYFQKPLMTQIFDELRFAIKCGGSAKKIQLSTQQQQQQQDPTANLHEHGFVQGTSLTRTLKSSSAGNLRNQINNDEDDQYERRTIAKDRHLKDRIVALNEREAALEAHNALITTHVLPHKHHHQSKYSSKPHGNTSTSKGSNGKHKKSSRMAGNEIKYFPDDDTDYILMRPISSSNRSLNRAAGADPEFFYEKAFNEQHEQQVNFDRYLSKSQIFKAQARSNRHL